MDSISKIFIPFLGFLVVGLVGAFYDLYRQKNTDESKIAALIRKVHSNDTGALGELRAKAEKGNAYVQFSLGEMYSEGRGVPKDYAEAVKWFRKAADQGAVAAQSILGLMYASGLGVSKDDAEAVKWGRKAADQGNASGQALLGIMYREGRGVPKHDGEAVVWFHKAADQGNAYGQGLLGEMYSEGRGVPKDDVEAYKWVFLAMVQGENGKAFAKDGLREIENKLTPEQRAEGKKRVRDFTEQLENKKRGVR